MTDLATLTAEIETLQQRRSDLETELGAVDRQLRDAQARAAPLAARARVLEGEPQAKKQLETLSQTLRAKLARAPATSPTAQRVRSQLASLADESMTAADRLTLCRSLLDDLKRFPQLDGDIRASTSPRVMGRE